MEMHITCLATVALNQYSSAGIVINFTVSNDPSVIQTEQFLMECVNGEWRSILQNFDNALPSMPFEIETQFQCSSCALDAPGLSNYDEVSNCFREYIHVRIRELENSAWV